MERPGGYMHDRVYPPFLFRITQKQTFSCDQLPEFAFGAKIRTCGWKGQGKSSWNSYPCFLDINFSLLISISRDNSAHFIHNEHFLCQMYTMHFQHLYFTRNNLSPRSSIRYSRSLLSTSTPPAATAIMTHVAAVAGPSIAAAAVAEIAATAAFLTSPSFFVTVYAVVAAAIARQPKHIVHAIFPVPFTFIKKSLIPHSTSI